MCVGDSMYDAFAHKFGRRHTSGHDYASRKQIFYENKAHIDDHNFFAVNSTHRQARLLTLPSHSLQRGL